MPKVNAGPLEGLPEDRCVAVDDGRVVVARLGDQVFAYDNECLHQASPLAGGMVKDGIITCPLHFWRYEAATGDCRNAKGARLASHATEIVDGEVLVDVPTVETPRSMREILLEHARRVEQDRSTDAG